MHPWKGSITLLLVLALLLSGIPAAAGAEAGMIGQPPPQVQCHVTAQVQNEAFAELSATEAYPNDPPESVNTVGEKVDWIARKCRETGLTDLWEIALWLHNWLIYNATYDYSYKNHEASGVLLKGTGVCESYAKAYALLLSEFGIENKLLISNSMDHAWNLMKIDGQWCHVDCTWDDPAEGGWENQSYFGMTDEMIGRDHTWSRSAYPKCTSDIHYYPVRRGYSCFGSREEMMVALSKEAEQGNGYFEMYYTGAEELFSCWDVLEEWQNTYNWRFGLMGAICQEAGSRVLVRIFYGGTEEKPLDFDETHIHIFASEEVQPTCTIPGYLIRECPCGYRCTDSETAALGHAYVDGTCSRCGALAADLNGDGQITDQDAHLLLWAVLFPEENAAAVDINGDTLTDEADAVYLMLYTLFPELYPV